MNITLSAPPNVVQNVRMWAEDHGTSLNAYIRDMLIQKDREICAELAERADAFLSFAKKNVVKVPKGWRYSRDEAVERKTKCVSGGKEGSRRK